MYLFPVVERTMNPPVWSDYDLDNLFISETGNMAHIILFVLMLFGSRLGWRLSSCSSLERGLMERRFFCSWAKCTLRLATLSGEYLDIKFVVSPGNISRLFNLIARRRVEE